MLVTVGVLVGFKTGLGQGASCNSASALAAGSAARSAVEGAEDGPRVAVQLYVWLQDRAGAGQSLWDDLDAVLGEVGTSGFQAIEGWLDFFETEGRAQRTRRLLGKHGLRLAGLYSGGGFHEPEAAAASLERIVACARRVRSRDGVYINVNPDPLPGKAPKSDEQLAVQARALDRLGRALAAMGLSLVVHNHDAEMVNDAREFRYLVDRLDPRFVGFCVDPHWVYRGEQEPLDLLRLAGRRIQVLHLRNSVGGVWSQTLGPGDVDYGRVAAFLREIDFRGWLTVEIAHEPGMTITRDLVANHRRARLFVEEMFLGRPADRRARTSTQPGRCAP